MSDFTSIHMDANTGSGAAGEGSGSATWTPWVFGGAAGVGEVRYCGSGAGSANLTYSAWPYYTLPASVGVVPEAWLFTADTGSSGGGTGSKITTFDGTAAHYLQFRFNWDNTGTFASAPSYTAYSDSTHAAASPGTQPGTRSGDPIINGSTDTGNASYLKSNAYGNGLTASGVQQTPSSSAGGTLAATSGTAGSVSPGSAAWLANWQSLQAATQFITNGVIPQAVTAGLWYFLLVLYSGPNMSTSSAMLPVLTLSYTYV